MSQIGRGRGFARMAVRWRVWPVRRTNDTNRMKPLRSCCKEHVEHGLHVPIESPLTDVRDHAHHRQPLAAIAHAHAPAERLRADHPGKDLRPHDALADNRHLRRVRRVPCGELASRQQRNPHGLENSPRRIFGVPALRLRSLSRASTPKIVLDEHHAERRRVNQARGRHARQGMDAIEHAARERINTAFGLAGELLGPRHPDGLFDAVAPGSIRSRATPT